MSKNILIFIGAFFVGALVALAIRTANHDPYAAPAPGPTIVPVEVEAESAPTTDTQAVNTVCAICGMDVDPDLATMTYKGKVIGFGCKNCLPKFAAEPDVYGPAALENKVVE